jgi:hypothetical protein
MSVEKVMRAFVEHLKEIMEDDKNHAHVEVAETKDWYEDGVYVMSATTTDNEQINLQWFKNGERVFKDEAEIERYEKKMGLKVISSVWRSDDDCPNVGWDGSIPVEVGAGVVVGLVKNIAICAGLPESKIWDKVNKSRLKAKFKIC